MPTGSDPADWLAGHGPNGLGDLFARACAEQDPDFPITVVPGREVIQVLLERVDDPIRGAVDIVAALAAQLPATERTQLVQQSVSEMTRHGWNPRDTYAKALEHAMRAAPTQAPVAPRTSVTPSLI